MKDMMKVFGLRDNIIVISCGKSVGYASFACDHKLNKVILSEGVELIDSYAFYNCGIEEIEVPSSVKEVSMKAFMYNENLKKLKLNVGLELIGNSAFSYCNIEKIKIPSSVKEIW